MEKNNNPSFFIRNLSFFTDGSCSTKTEMGGWACICVEDDNVIDTFSGYEPYTTNNRMELMAFLAALEAAKMVESGHTAITIFTDSAYIVNCINQKWYLAWLKDNKWKTSDKQDVKNQDLWSQILALYIKLRGSKRISLSVEKVKGHADNQYNCFVDLLANKRRKELEVIAEKYDRKGGKE